MNSHPVWWRWTLALGLLCGSLSAADWPQILGPDRNGIYTGPALATHWPKEGPPIRWQRKVGEGFSGPAVAEGKLILFHRVNDREITEALDARTGKPLWSASHPTHYRDQFGFDNGPRAVPTVTGGRVYTFGAEGVLTCLNLADGKLVWEVSLVDKYQADLGFFGLVGSPLVEGNAVLLNPGGANGAGLVALNKDTGALLWKATDAGASYSSPVAATLEQKRSVLFFTREGLVVVDPASGKVQFEYEWKPAIRESVSAANPLVIGDDIFLSASYNAGAILLHAADHHLAKVWSGDDLLSNHYATSVYRDGFLYGLDGRHDYPGGTTLRCVEFKTGKVRWSVPGLSPANVLLAGDQLLVLTERGELIRLAAKPDAGTINERAQILSAGVRAFPALADGWFYARSKDRLVAVDLSVQ